MLATPREREVTLTMRMAPLCWLLAALISMCNIKEAHGKCSIMVAHDIYFDLVFAENPAGNTPSNTLFMVM